MEIKFTMRNNRDVKGILNVDNVEDIFDTKKQKGNISIKKGTKINENPNYKKIQTDGTKELIKKIIEKRDDLKAKNIINENEFLQDYNKFESLCDAGKIISGHSFATYDHFGEIEEDESFISFKDKYGKDFKIWSVHGKMAPNENGRWFLENGFIAIGWPDVGDLTKIKTKFKENLNEKIKQYYPAAAVVSTYGNLNRFFKEVKVNDYVVFSPDKNSDEINIGQITGEYYYDDSKGPNYAHFRNVEWIKQLSRKNYSKIFNSQKAQQSITKINKNIDKILEIIKSEDDKNEINNKNISNSDKNNNDDNTQIEIFKISNNDRQTDAQNKIYYGIPGCGKSYKVDKDYCKKGYGIERVVFYPDYSYADFVGQCMPTKDVKGNQTFDFVPGPFTRILKDAWKNP